jgi:hypothetical protein
MIKENKQLSTSKLPPSIIFLIPFFSIRSLFVDLYTPSKQYQLLDTSPLVCIGIYLISRLSRALSAQRVNFLEFANTHALLSAFNIDNHNR